MAASNHSDFDQQSLESLRKNLARIVELWSELNREELKQHIAASGEAILGIMARYQQQTLRALISVGVSLGALVIAVSARSLWLAVLAFLAFGVVCASRTDL